MSTAIKPAESVNTAPVVAAGLIGGWLTARETGIRPLGGVVLAAAGIYAGRTWLARRGPATTAVLGATYVLGFGLSHPLAKKIGAWPAVLTVTAASATASVAVDEATLTNRWAQIVLTPSADSTAGADATGERPAPLTLVLNLGEEDAPAPGEVLEAVSGADMLDAVGPAAEGTVPAHGLAVVR